ncbi:MAG TPA: MMPL family transporter [Caulobacteraceae bacterium]
MAVSAEAATKETRASLFGRWVAFCADHALTVSLIVLVLGVVAAVYAVGHFAMSTNTDELISKALPWRQQEAAFDKAFPQNTAQIVIVIDGKTPELAEQATNALTEKLQADTKLFPSVRLADSGPFWSRNGLLYAPLADVKSDMDKLIAAQPFLGPVAADPSLRGVADTLNTTLQGVTSGEASLHDLGKPIHSLADTLEALKAGKPAYFSWRAMIAGGKPDPRELRHLILVDPKLNFDQLEPGADAADAIRAAAKDLKLDAGHGVNLRLTGETPLQDDEFGTLADRIWLIAGLSLGAIILMLWLAVKSARLIIAILVTTLIGLVMAAAWGLLVYGRYNVISVAFIPLFVGLGIDFGIQFSVRFRAERALGESERQALQSTGRGIGRQLTLAAVAIASGFLAFAPTDYHGLSQLGVVAGLGMFIALALNMTLLPALISLLHPKPPPETGAQPLLEKLDAFILGRRRLVIGTAAGAALVSAALLPLLHFDFNPLHLRSAKVESVSALLDLLKDPNLSPNTLEVVRPSLAAADAVAAKARTLPQVSEARTLSSLIPAQQPEKLAIIHDAAMLLDLTLNPIVTQPPPSDAEVVASLRQAATSLRASAGQAQDSGSADARRLASNFEALAAGPPTGRTRAAETIVPPLTVVLTDISATFQAEAVNLQTLPPDLVRDWTTPDGRARVSLVPKGDANNNAVLRRFIAAVTTVAPDATGPLFSISKSGDTVLRAFIQAGVLSFIAITALLFAVLRRPRDVAITMAPIILTGLLTLGSCVLIGQPLNFANIIALPLLFGIGVAFHIYFVMSWRSGGSHLLTSSLARAIFFSALATATGFGSLWMSSHPGTASMGKLLMISLVWTLVSALLFQPALMGAPDKAPTQP